jgi:hypothetical protein
MPGVVMREAEVGERPLTVLHPALAARYASLVAAVAPAVEASLSPAVCANRVERAAPSTGELRLTSWRDERVAFGARLRVLARSSEVLVFADVRACFASIGADQVARALRAVGAASTDRDAVAAFLVRLRRLGVIGLPVGPEASAVLANAVLIPLDRAVEQLGVPHLRWVDDVVAGVVSAAEGSRVLAALGRAAAGVALRLNDGKTRVVPATQAGGVRVSGKARTPVG